MENNKYLLVTSDELTETNIAVLKCDKDGNFKTDNLVTALSEHLDLDVCVNSIEEFSKYPLTLIAKCSSFGNDEQDEISMFNVQLNETWLY